MGRDDSDTLARLKAHRRELIDPKIAEYGGRIVKTTGDGLLLEFPSVVDAVRCAVDVQRGMAERNATLPPQQRIDFRIASTSATSSSTADIRTASCRRTVQMSGARRICTSKVVRDRADAEPPEVLGAASHEHRASG
jgi:class 3 adenylate cyclase